jgi:O-antigen/teichoic acid export membrane protein
MMGLLIDKILLRSPFNLNSELARRFTGILSIDILVKASGFILLPVFLRLMTQEEFGVYNYLISIIQLFALVLNFGLYIPISKFYHSFERPQLKGKYLFTAFVTLLFLLILLCLLGMAFRLDYVIVDILFDTPFNYGYYRPILMMALLSTVFSFMLTSFFYTSEKIKQVKLYNICRIVIVNLAALVMLNLLTGNSVLVRLSASYIVELILLLFFSYYLISEMMIGFDRKLMWRSVTMGFPIMTSAIFGIIVNFSDKFLLQKHGSLIDLSNYYLGFSFAGILQIIFASLQNVWLPLFLKEKDLQRNFKKTQGLIFRLLVSFLILSLFIWLLFIILVKIEIIPIKYSLVIKILPFLLVAQIFASITTLLTNYLIYFEKTGIATLTGLAVSLLSIGMGLWLIPVWGVMGAAITALLVNMIFMLLYYGIIHYLKNQHLKSIAVL